MYNALIAAIVLSSAQLDKCSSFVIRPTSRSTFSKSPLSMAAGGKGFGKQDTTDIEKKKRVPSPRPSSDESFSMPLQSITDADPAELDPSLPPEQRTKQILREKYGLRTFEEQQGDLKAMQYKEKVKEMKKQADLGKDIDIFQLIPAPLLVFTDRFLKIGLGLSVVLFVAAGIGITLEAWAHASGGNLPEGLDKFIVETIEPNFTPGLLVLLGFSVSLGLFAAAQLGSESSQYSEK